MRTVYPLDFIVFGQKLWCWQKDMENNYINEVVNIIQAYQNGREEAILSVYMCPSLLINNTSGSTDRIDS